MSWKRNLFLFHRWTGIALCVFIALWFVSGIVMMYVDFPLLTRPERLAGQSTLDFSRAVLSPADAVARLTGNDFAIASAPSGDVTLNVSSIPALRAMRLSMLLGRPVYVAQAANGTQPRTVFADTGETLKLLSAEQAVASAIDFAARAGWPVDQPAYLGQVQTDQWTVSGALNDHRPLHRIVLGDANGTELYVSSTTGAVVRDTHRRERVLNYFGAVTHWVYPTFLRKYPNAWEWTVDILSSMACVFALSGLWIGVLRWRRKRAPGKPAVPYRGLMRWHYFAGISFGIVLLTWTLSGLLSMNPAQLNPSRAPSAEQMHALTGGALRVSDFGMPAKVLPRDAVEAELLHFDGQPFYTVTARDGGRSLIAASDEPARLPNSNRVLALAQRLLPNAAIVRSQVLNEYDNYYYSRRPEHQDKSLPVMRVQFDDVHGTWFHIDALTGQVLERLNATNRLYRWLYNGLHSWDIRWLRVQRPLWDVALLVFLCGGLMLASIGIAIGVKRIRYR